MIVFGFPKPAHKLAAQIVGDAHFHTWINSLSVIGVRRHIGADERSWTVQFSDTEFGWYEHVRAVVNDFGDLVAVPA